MNDPRSRAPANSLYIATCSSRPYLLDDIVKGVSSVGIGEDRRYDVLGIEMACAFESRAGTLGHIIRLAG